jgi:hypothetical protein
VGPIRIIGNYPALPGTNKKTETVNGFIEIYVDGWIRYRWLFTLRDYESFPFEQQVDLREADLKKIIDHLRENVVPNFDPGRTEFCIAYESKMNSNDYSEMFIDQPDDLHKEESRADDCHADGGTPEGGKV